VVLNIGGGDGLATYSQCIGWPDRARVWVDRLYVARSVMAIPEPATRQEILAANYTFAPPQTTTS
jgi:hypothetical protein